MTLYQEAKEIVYSGLRGDAIYIPLTKHPLTDELSKLGGKLCIGKAQYVVFGGMPGSGKTAIVDSQFVLNIYFWWLRNRENTSIKPYWIYRSMERPAKFKILKWTAYLMYIEHGILTDTNILAGKPNRKRDITEKELELMEHYEKFFDEFMNHIEIIPGPENPTGIDKSNWRIAKQKGKYLSTYKAESDTYGKLLLNDKVIAELNQFEELNNRKKFYTDITINGISHRHYEYQKKYFATNPNEIVFHVIDHAGKVTGERSFSDKQVLDKTANYNGIIRDLCDWTIIDIYQLNRGIEDTQRKIKLGADIGYSDFKGSSTAVENADTIIGLLNPYKLDDMDYDGYKISDFINEEGDNTFRSLKILKNSDGVDDFRIGYCFLGGIGLMYELPRAEKMTLEIYKNCKEGKLPIHKQ